MAIDVASDKSHHHGKYNSYFGSGATGKNREICRRESINQSEWCYVCSQVLGGISINESTTRRLHPRNFFL